jgi:hypothetical protein
VRNFSALLVIALLAGALPTVVAANPSNGGVSSTAPQGAQISQEKRKKVVGETVKGAKRHIGWTASRKVTPSRSSYPSRRTSRAVAWREAAARDAARSRAVADVPKAAPREKVESYSLPVSKRASIN